MVVIDLVEWSWWWSVGGYDGCSSGVLVLKACGGGKVLLLVSDWWRWWR